MEYVIYCRKSTDEGTDRQVQSIPDQIEECMEFAERNKLVIASKARGFEVFETEQEVQKQDADPYGSPTFRKYRDFFIVKEQKTAKEPGVREKRKELIRRVKAGRVKGILSYTPDRQARNMQDGGELITLVDEGRLDLKYTRFHFEPIATGKMMLGFLFVQSKYYSDAISENVSRGLKTSVERGRAVGKNKYGYIINGDGYLEPDGDNFDLMKEAFRLKIYENKTNEYIGSFLNTGGFTRSIRGRSQVRTNWKDLSRIWQDPFYYGIHVYGASQSDQREVNPDYKPMISEEEYHVLQSKLGAGNTVVEVRDENFEINPLGKGLLIAEDSHPFVHDFPNKRRYTKKLEKIKQTKADATLADVVKETQIYYSMKNKESSLNSLSVPYSEIEKHIIDYIKQIKIDEETYKHYMAYCTHQYEIERDDREQKRKKIQFQRNALSGKLESFVKQNMSSTKDQFENEIYMKERKRLEHDIKMLDDQLQALEDTDKNGIVILEGLLKVFDKMEENFNKLDYVRRRNFIQLLFSNIVINEKRQVRTLPFPYVEQLLIAGSADDATRTRNILLGKEVH